MNWIVRFLGSSVGKKQIMAATGTGFIAFLTVHLIGNFTMYGGSDYFNKYAETLHSLGPVITAFELGLLAFALIHVGTGLLLFFQNLTARPQRYQVKKSAGGQTLSSSIMPYTGLVILAFVVIHLLNFTFADTADRELSEVVAAVFNRPGYIVFYLASVAVVALHIRHGFWSAFQTFGLNHPRYMPIIMTGAVIAALMFAVGFGSLPIFILVTA